MSDSQLNKKSAIWQSTSTSVRQQNLTASILAETYVFLHESVAFDAIIDMAFSDRIGFVKEGRDVNAIIKSLTELFKVTRIMTTFPTLQNIMNNQWVKPLLGPKPTDDYGPGMIRGVSTHFPYFLLESRHKALGVPRWQSKR
jgi:hypothetical protein